MRSNSAQDLQKNTVFIKIFSKIAVFLKDMEPSKNFQIF